MKLFTLSLFALGAMLSSNAFAATGTGHAQAELTNPLTVTNEINVNFGTIAIDPGAGAQTVSLAFDQSIVCPGTYVCSGSVTRGQIGVTGAPNTSVNLNMTGSIATLDDGLGNQLIFDPMFSNDTDVSSAGLNTEGVRYFYIHGSINFDGTEVAGTYSSLNAGGSGYTVTVNY